MIATAAIVNSKGCKSFRSLNGNSNSKRYGFEQDEWYYTRGGYKWFDYYLEDSQLNLEDQFITLLQEGRRLKK